MKKDIIKAEFDFNFNERILYQIARKEYLYKRLFFLKKFGFPLGCIIDSFNPVIESCTPDNRETDYAYRGVRFMDKFIKPTKNGWQVKFVYRS